MKREQPPREQRQASRVLGRLGFRSLAELVAPAPQPLPASAAKCWWCDLPRASAVEGWTVADLSEPHVARYLTQHGLGGFTDNYVTLNAGAYAACPACTTDRARGGPAAIVARTGNTPLLPLLETLHRRLKPAVPLREPKASR